MIGEQHLEDMQLNNGFGHVVYTGGAKGTDELVEQMARHFGMQVEVLVPPAQSSPSPIRHSFHGGSVDARQPPSSPGCS